MPFTGGIVERFRCGRESTAHLGEQGPESAEQGVGQTLDWDLDYWLVQSLDDRSQRERFGKRLTRPHENGGRLIQALERFPDEAGFPDAGLPLHDQDRRSSLEPLAKAAQILVATDEARAGDDARRWRHQVDILARFSAPWPFPPPIQRKPSPNDGTFIRDNRGKDPGCRGSSSAVQTYPSDDGAVHVSMFWRSVYPVYVTA
jgi:hypothetical protein